MAAEETRDVVIRLAIKQIAQKVTVDTSQAERSISRYQSAISKAVSSATREFEKLRIAGFESMAAIEMEGTDAAGAVGKVGGSAEAAASQASAPLQEIAVELEVLAASAEQVSAGLQNMEMSAQALKRVEKMTLSAAVGFQRAAGGALQLVRASALLGFSADDDLHRFLRQLAKIQGAMDLLSGGLSVYRGITTAIERMATANKLNAAAAAGAAGSSQILVTALGQLAPHALALGVGGAAFVAVGAFFVSIATEAKRAAEETERTNKALRDTEQNWRRRDQDIRRRQRQLMTEPEAAASIDEDVQESKDRLRVLQDREAELEAEEDRLLDDWNTPSTRSMPGAMGTGESVVGGRWDEHQRTKTGKEIRELGETQVSNLQEQNQEINQHIDLLHERRRLETELLEKAKQRISETPGLTDAQKDQQLRQVQAHYDNVMAQYDAVLNNLLNMLHGINARLKESENMSEPFQAQRFIEDEKK